MDSSLEFLLHNPLLFVPLVSSFKKRGLRTVFQHPFILLELRTRGGHAATLKSITVSRGNRQLVDVQAVQCDVDWGAGEQLEGILASSCHKEGVLHPPTPSGLCGLNSSAEGHFPGT